MKKGLKAVVSLAVALGLGASGAARAQSYYSNTNTSGTTTLLATTGGVAALIYFLVKPKQAPAPKDPDEGETTKAAQLFLEQNALQLAQDFNAGRGPLIDGLAAELALDAQHKALFGEAIRTHRVELLALANPERLSLERARAFTQKLVDLMNADPALRGDLQKFAATARLN